MVHGDLIDSRSERKPKQLVFTISVFYSGISICLYLNSGCKHLTDSSLKKPLQADLIDENVATSVLKRNEVKGD